MTKVISFVNAKGGVGKTTTCVNVAAGLAAKGNNVLLIDLDPQANATSYFTPQDVRFDVSDLLLDRAKFDDVVKTCHGMDILPVAPHAIGLENKLTVEMNAEMKLYSNASDELERYDYVVIDCPPALGKITANALLVSDYYIVPLVPEPFAVKGIADLWGFVEKVQKVNKDLKFAGFLFNRYNRKKKNSTHAAIEEYVNKLGMPTFTTSIREDKTLYDVVLAQSGTIFSGNESKNCVQDFTSLCNEIAAL